MALPPPFDWRRGSIRRVALFLLGHVEQLAGLVLADHGRMVLPDVALEVDEQLVVVLASDDVTALAIDDLRHVGLLTRSVAPLSPAGFAITLQRHCSLR